jgi:hypothetical protein
MSTNDETRYAILWFEDDAAFTLVDDSDKTVVLSESEAKAEASTILRNENEVEEAESGVRYAVPTQLLDELFGWIV